MKTFLQYENMIINISTITYAEMNNGFLTLHLADGNTQTMGGETAEDTWRRLTWEADSIFEKVPKGESFKPKGFAEEERRLTEKT